MGGWGAVRPLLAGCLWLSALAGCGDEPGSAPSSDDDAVDTDDEQDTELVATTTAGPGVDEPEDDGTCDPFLQDCGAGRKCVPYSENGDATWNGLTCRALPSTPAQLGEPCTAPSGAVAGEDDCDAGLICWGIAPGDTQGTCAALCEGTVAQPYCSSIDTVCSIYNDGALPICLPTCDPLGNDCPEGEVCIPQGTGSKFVCAYDAAPDGGAFGDPCLAFNKCDPGLFCAPASAVPGCTEATGCCTEFCDLDDAGFACVGEGQSCVPWSDAPAPGFESVGACALPS